MAQSVERATRVLRVVGPSPTSGVEMTLKIKSFRGAWVAQSVKHPPLDLPKKMIINFKNNDKINFFFKWGVGWVVPGWLSQKNV